MKVFVAGPDYWMEIGWRLMAWQAKMCKNR
jgi:hypothetical protein